MILGLKAFISTGCNAFHKFRLDRYILCGKIMPCMSVLSRAVAFDWQTWVSTGYDVLGHWVTGHPDIPETLNTQVVTLDDQ